MNLPAIQEALREEGLDGWLFFDHHHRDPLAYRILGLPESVHASRRWYYVIPASGEPRGLVHRIEPHSLRTLPGEMRQYSRWTEQLEELRKLVAGCKSLAMQYSPQCAVPYVSMIDGGTVELVQSLGVQVKTSANLVQKFEACWSHQQREMRFEAGRRMDGIREEAFDLIRAQIGAIDEWDVRQFLRKRFSESGLITDHGPIVAVNSNASDPHYEPSAEQHQPIQAGDVVLIDMWAKLDTPDAVYYDITWTAYCGPQAPEKVQQVFEAVSNARDRGVAFVQEALAKQRPLAGFEVDDAVRQTIEQAGYGQYFIHRTGHSIGTEVHGSGANMDNFETHDTRSVIANTCFSIEPGVYLPAFGIRSEVNVFVSETEAVVTGEMQQQLLLLG